RFHAGNVGDVWKHCVLAEVLARGAAGAARAAYLDTHAGEGNYPLGATGEWSEGIGRLWRQGPAADGAAARYLALCRRLGAGAERPTRYPGSPAFAAALLGDGAEIRLWERDAAVCGALRRALGGDRRVHLAHGDGLAGLADAVRDAERRCEAVVVLIDPPWLQKADWIAVPDALAQAAAASSRATFVLWYPVKSLTRPNAMIARLAAAGVAGTIAELVTTPLAQQRNRLNGSGVVLLRPPAGATAAIAEAAPELGAACATQAGTWSFRMQSWPGC
ncbi:MAG: 23S rRNA (adenine(2030)-N(6))-methyltransferase RlmJ, partial [Deltaproteobacteria bacterium]|nr:23S rRNA (adenine(2030)-N(6))-methyltransferase RlmJ [Deltaproteobacteria bacterium]